VEASKMNSVEFGKYLSRLREEAGFKNREALYNASGIYPTTIKRLEEGLVKTPSVEMLKKLAAYLKIAPIDLMIAAGYIDEKTLSSEDKIYFGIAEIPDNTDKEILLNMLNSLREKHGLPKINF
jgi:transcriptional regulator with XRE-family HTH domain